MAEVTQANPAEVAAERALERIFSCIHQRRNFRLEAGAGAGKTYSLIKALGLVIREQADELKRKNQQIACITYTNVATDEITSRTDGHPVIYASTIHAFCWHLIRGFQSSLRTRMPKIDGWPEKLEEVGGIGSRRVEYDLGYRHVGDSEVLIGHDDVLSLAVMLLKEKKFRELLIARFPILFIDEYQDTNAKIAESIVDHFVAPNNGPLIGLFGDSWQKIYGDGCGLIDHANLCFIGKEANFRSVKTIVDVLNRMRHELPQEVKDPEATGFMIVYHTNEFTGTRRTGNHWAGDLPAHDAHACLEAAIKNLKAEGWDFSPEKTKILMLTHNILANEQGYQDLANVFRYNDSYIKKESQHISFLVDTVEPVCIAYGARHFGEMFANLGSRTVAVKSLDDKLAWARDMDCLMELRENGSIGDVLDHMKTVGRPRLPESVSNAETKLKNTSSEEIAESRTLREIEKLREVPYKQVVSLAEYLNDYTPFSTNHGVKGAEFENVLVVLGRGWNRYNWNQFLEWVPDRFPINKAEFNERNRNLFYMACSRPKERLALLFTQELSPKALETLISWFGSQAIYSIYSH